MTESQPVVFLVGGTISDVETGRDFAIAVNDAGFTPPDGRAYVSVLDALRHIWNAHTPADPFGESSTTPLEIHHVSMREDELQEFEAACRKLGMPYERRLPSREGANVVRWTPTEANAIPLRSVIEAHRDGRQAMERLISRYAADRGETLALTIDRRVVGELLLLSDDDWNKPFGELRGKLVDGGHLSA